MSAPIRVVIVDDQELVRTGFRMILESEDDITVVDEARDGAEALEVIAAATPDVVLMDVRMPVMDGVEATGRIPTDGPSVVILTTFDLDEYVFSAIEAGASGFLLKDTPADDLVAAVRIIAAGESLLAPTVTRRLIEQFRSRGGPRPAIHPGIATLTEREHEVLVQLAGGHSNAEIAEELFVSEATIKTHVSRVLTKLGVRDRVQAVVLAYDHGIVAPGG